MEAVLVTFVTIVIAYWIYRAGKREGSTKFGVGDLGNGSRHAVSTAAAIQVLRQPNSPALAYRCRP
jgi:hypothetical protein